MSVSTPLQTEWQPPQLPEYNPSTGEDLSRQYGLYPADLYEQSRYPSMPADAHQKLTDAGWWQCPTKKDTHGKPCEFWLNPQAKDAIAGHSNYMTCPKCRQTNQILEDLPWHGVWDPEEAFGYTEVGAGQAGGGTHIGIPMEDQGQIGENLVRAMKEIPGYGPITSWHPGGAGSQSPLDGTTADWGIEVKTISQDAANHKFNPGGEGPSGTRQYTEEKNNAAQKMGLKGVLGVLVMLDYRRDVADIYVKAMPLAPWKNSRGRTLQGVAQFHKYTAEKLVAEVPFQSPYKDPNNPSPGPYRAMDYYEKPQARESSFDPDKITANQINDYRKAAQQAWGEDTRYEGTVGHPDPSAGQCYVTSSWLQKKLGGYVGTKHGHFFWVSPDKSHVIDLTGDLFTHHPVDPNLEGTQINPDDEPLHLDPHHHTHRPGPAMYKRADHPIWKGFRVLPEYPDHQRAQIFAKRADAALRGHRVSDLLGPTEYTGDTPQKREDWDQGKPFPMLHDEPNWDPKGLESQEYKWIFANGQVHVSPMHEHEELFGHAGAHPASEGPTAVGFVTVHQGHALWEVESNVSMRGLHDLLEEYSETVGWDFDGMVGSNGAQIHEDFGPKITMWYKYRTDGHLILSKTPLPSGDTIRIKGKTAHVAKTSDALEEWARDFGYKLAWDGVEKEYTPEEFQQWTPGQFGKGALLPNGQYVTWTTDASGDPHHEDYFNAHGLNFLEAGDNNISIAPSGHYTHSWGLNADEAPFGKEKGFARHDPRLTFVPDHNVWTKELYRGHYGHRLAEWPGGSDMTDQMKNREHLDVYNRGDMDFQPERDNPDQELGPVSCGECDREFPSLRALQLHHKDHEPQDTEEVPEARFPYPDDMDAPLPYRRRTPIPETAWNGYQGKTVVMPLPNHKYAARFPRYQLYSGLFEFDKDEGMRFYGAFRQGQLVGYGAVRLNASPEPEVLIIDTLQHRSGVGTAILGLIENHFGGFYTHADSEGGERLMRRNGMVNVKGHRWRWSKGDQPKDMIEAALPFIYDIDGDKDHKQGMIHIGYPGQRTSDIPGRFTPGGIVEGYYEPGGKVVLISATNMPYTVYGFANLWYHLYPQMEITSVESEGADGKTQKLAANEVGNTVRALIPSDRAAYNAYQALKEAGGKVYAVGGVIRDVILGKEHNDIDLMVAGLPTEQVDHILGKLPGHVDVTGKRFGVYRYKAGGHEVEIALPRTDRYDESRRGKGIITVNHDLPVEKDLQRRDFTAQSMAVDLDNGRLIDPYEGQKDLESNLLRTTHPDSFREDPTRLVRALVANGRFGLQPDERTRDEMESHGHLLRHESPDALNKITDKLFKSPNPAAAIRLAQETGVLSHLFPEVADNWDFDQNNPHHHKKLGEHLVQVLDNTARQTTDPDVRLAALYHDVGKPQSAWTNPETGKFHYYQGPNGEGANHEDVGARMVAQRMGHQDTSDGVRGLNYPKTRINRVQDLVQHHMFPSFSTERGARKFLQRVGPHADDLLTLRQADMTGKGQPIEDVAARTSVDTMRGLVDQTRRQQNATDVQNLAINGNDLIGLGMQPGPQIGNTLRALVDEVVNQPTLNVRNTLLQLAEQYVTAMPGTQMS